MEKREPKDKPCEEMLKKKAGRKGNMSKSDVEIDEPKLKAGGKSKGKPADKPKDNLEESDGANGDKLDKKELQKVTAPEDGNQNVGDSEKEADKNKEKDPEEQNEVVEVDSVDETQQDSPSSGAGLQKLLPDNQLGETNPADSHTDPEWKRALMRPSTADLEQASQQEVENDELKKKTVATPIVGPVKETKEDKSDHAGKQDIKKDELIEENTADGNEEKSLKKEEAKEDNGKQDQNTKKDSTADGKEEQSPKMEETNEDNGKHDKDPKKDEKKEGEDKDRKEDEKKEGEDKDRKKDEQKEGENEDPKKDEDTIAEEEKEKKRKAAHARYMRFYRSITEGQLHCLNQFIT